MKKALIVLVALVLIVGMVGAVSANVFGGIVSWFVPGAGEWLTKKATFGQCCVENIWSWIPVFGTIFVRLGSVIDNFKDVDEPQVNWLFGTKSLAK